MTRSRPVRDPRVAGLYAVTPETDDTERLVAMVDAAIRGGARLVQFRSKSGDRALRFRQAARLAELCAGHGRPLIVNDDLDLALSIDDAGLHVGREDFDGPDALDGLRTALGRSRLLGVSCYRSLDRAYEAAHRGADYVAFGSVFASPTKPAAPPASLAAFVAARNLGVAVVGIGGITRDNLPSLVAAGADAAAVITDLFASADDATITVRARELAAAFDRPRPSLPWTETSP